MLQFAILLGLLATSLINARATGVEISGFETSDHGWKIRNEAPSPSSKSKAEIDEREAHNGQTSLRISVDFTDGSAAAVAVTRKLLSPAKILNFWVKAPGVRMLDVALTDFSGQTFRHRIALQGNSEWQQVVLDHFSDTKDFSGGPADGVWYRPLKEISIGFAKSDLAENVTESSLWIDDVSVEEEPLAKPIATEKITLSRDTIFGFSNHMMHTDFFYGKDRMGPYSKLEYTLPWMVNGRFGLTREPLYQGFFAGESRDEKTRAANRAMIEANLHEFGKAGVRVLLCPMFARAGKEGFDDFFSWLGSLPARYPAVVGIEMHNEPHLKFFGGWQGDEYATAVKRAAEILHRQAPDTPIIIGSMSHLWWGPAVKFIESVMQNGALEVADGISVHPYRKEQAPEGGAGHSAKEDPNGLETEMRDFWTLIQRHNPTGKPLQLHLTEFGYSSGIGKGAIAPDQSAGIGTLERQADYLSRIMLVLFDLRLEGIPLQGLYWYNLKADRKASKDVEGNFGLIDYEAGEARPGYGVYAQLAGMFQNTGDWWSLDTSALFSASPDVIKSFVWKRLSDGALIVPFWRMNQLQKEDVDFASDLTLALPPGFKVARRHPPRPPGGQASRDKIYGIRGNSPRAA